MKKSGKISDTPTKLKGYGNRIQNKMDELGLSLIQVADRCGFKGVSRVSNYAREYRMPSPDVFALIAKALNTTPSYLMFGTDSIAWEVSDAVGSKVMTAHSPKFVPVIPWELAHAWKEIKSSRNELIIDFVPDFNVTSEFCYALIVRGDSMQQTSSGKYSFSNNDVLIIDGARRPVSNDIVVADVGEKGNMGETLLKKYVYEGGKHYLLDLQDRIPAREIADTSCIFGVLSKRYQVPDKY